MPGRDRRLRDGRRRRPGGGQQGRAHRQPGAHGRARASGSRTLKQYVRQTLRVSPGRHPRGAGLQRHGRRRQPRPAGPVQPALHQLGGPPGRGGDRQGRPWPSSRASPTSTPPTGPASRSSRWSVDRERAAAVGVPAAALGSTVRALMGGDKVTDFHQGGDTYDIKVRLPEAVLADPSALGARGGAGRQRPAGGAAQRGRRQGLAPARRRSSTRPRCARSPSWPTCGTTPSARRRPS